MGRAEGERAYALFVDDSGDATPIDPRHDLRNHSPDGFEWGYGGSGPAQLALAILAHHLRASGRPEPDRLALACHQDFKWDKVADRDREPWILPADHVERWYEVFGTQRAD
jgi:hypothetical protein